MDIENNGSKCIKCADGYILDTSTGTCVTESSCISDKTKTVTLDKY